MYMKGVSLRHCEMIKRMGNSNKNKQKQQRRRAKTAPGPLITPFPPRRTARFRYVHPTSIGGAGPGVGDFVAYSPSSLYDPEVALGGHQPMYYDQLLTATGPYTRYLVTGCRVKMEMTNFSVASTPVMVVVYVAPVSTSPASSIQALEKPWSFRRELSNPAGGNCNAKIQFYVPSEKALGISKSHLLTDEYYAGVYNANPAVNWFIVVCVYGVANPCSVHIVTDMEMDTILYSLGNQSTS